MGKPGSESVPVVAKGVMYLTAPDGVYALLPQAGELLWTMTRTGGPAPPGVLTGARGLHSPANSNRLE
jgi:hypothetical protein